MWMELLHHTWDSLARVFWGTLLGVLVGLAYAILRFLLPESWQKNSVLRFILNLPKYPPPLAWVPFVILAFGISEVGSIVIVAIGVFPAVMTQVYEGLLRIPTGLKEIAASMELRGIPLIFKIYLPSLKPQFFTGLRVGLAMGWMSIIAAEMIAGQSGLGYLIQTDRLYLNFSGMIYDMLAIALAGGFLQWILHWIEKKLVPWSEEFRNQRASS